MTRNICGLLFVAVLLLTPVSDFAIGETVGTLLNTPDSFVGYTLFPPSTSNMTYLVDNNGYLINSWSSNYLPGVSAYLYENGDLLRIGKGGYVEVYEWDGDLSWSFDYYDPSDHRAHHDVENLPNGNVLMISRNFKTPAEAISQGRDPAITPADRLFAEYLVEVAPDGLGGGEIIWQWHIWDHLIQDYDPAMDNYGVVADHPELMDVNFVYSPEDDWLHLNGIDYNPQLDQIALSFRGTHEIMIIDHSTTTEEAASHSGGLSGKGGDILYRWGNPQAYGAGTEADRTLYGQHDARWVEPGFPGEGNIMVFNNGPDRPGGNFSSVDEIVTSVDASGHYAITPGSAYDPVAPVWSYTAENPSDFYAAHFSGAHRLPNGNTVICNGDNGHIFEVTPESETVWYYVCPVNSLGPIRQGTVPTGNNVFKVYKYAPEFSGFDGRPMTPGETIEIELVVSAGDNDLPANSLLDSAYPNPFNPQTSIAYKLSEQTTVSLRIFDLNGRLVDVLVAGETQEAGPQTATWNGRDSQGQEVPSGTYFVRLVTSEGNDVTKVMLVR